MDDTIDTVTISNEPIDGLLDFQFLREEGIRHIQRLAGKIWTDYNFHDPGITILDQLCYAITDLSYRINYDIKDLLAGEKESTYQSLYSPAQILTINPVTLLDIRKVIIDVEGVKNAWIEKATQPEPDIFYDAQTKSLNLADAEGNDERLYLAGLYKVVIESDPAALLSNMILPNVKQTLHNCRNLCEDFSEINILVQQLVTLSGNIEVGQVEDINVFAGSVLYRVANFISPRIKFYTLEELLNNGKRVDEIFDGPVLRHGFIDDDELAANDRKTELHTSDIIRVLMDEPEVVTVNQIGLAIGGERPENWRLILDKDKMPRLDWQASLMNLVFFKNDLKLTPDVIKVGETFTRLQNANLYFPLDETNRDIKLQEGDHRDIGAYYSIQNHFPLVFGVGEIGLPDSVSAKRTAQAKQLKAFLLFFEQILANYFAQLAHMKDLFSFHNTDLSTYYYQSLVELVPSSSDISNDLKSYKKSVTAYPGNDEITVMELVPGAGEILANLPSYKARLAAYTEDVQTAVERKNRFLNHLLARFGESLTDYSLWLYDQSLPTSKQSKGADDKTTPASEKLVEDKLSFVRNYPLMSNDRGKAFNFTLKSWGTENISGLEKRIAGKLGISNYTKRSLLGNNEKGFHMLEHILLRPVAQDFSAFTEYVATKDIKSFVASGNNTKCLSIGHGLQNGEQIEIRGSQGYDGEYIVQQVLTDSFEIAKGYVEPPKNDSNTPARQPTWQRTQVNTKILLLTRPITGFSAAPDSKTVVAALNHGLDENESVEIIGTINYDGIYKAANVTENSFVIDKEFKPNETEGKGRWINPAQRKDPYSLQLSFVFPDTVDSALPADKVRKDNYRAFIENTIREETPVHLTVYVRWLDQNELQKFESAYQTFLDQLTNN